MSAATKIPDAAERVQRGERLLPTGRPVLAVVEDEARRDADDMQRALEDLGRAGFLAAQEAAAAAKGDSLSFLRGDELLAMEFPATQWVVDGLIPDHGVVAIAGEPKTMKTWVAMELGVAVASGGRAFGEFQARGAKPVIMVLVESTPRETQNRLRSILAAAGPGARKAAENIRVANLAALNLTDPAALARLVTKVRRLAPDGAGMLVLDPLRDLHGVDENDSSAMSQVTSALRALRTTLSCPVVFIHHMSKAPTDGNNKRRGGQQMRGSSVLHATIDAGIYLRHGDGGDGQNAWVLKTESETRNGRGAGRFTLRLEVDDNEQREAVRASWVYSREDSEKTDPKMAAVLGALRGAEDPLSVNEVARRADVSPHTAKDRLVKAEKADKARRTEDGEWVALLQQ